MSIKVKTRTLMILWCAFLWCTPQGLQLMFSQYVSIFNILKCFMWAILLFMLVIRKKKMGTFCVVLHCFWLIFLGCILSVEFTIKGINTWLVPFCSVCGFCVLLSLYSEKVVTAVFFKYCYLMSIINLILLFVMPGGFAFQLTAFDGLSKYDTYSNFISTDNTYAPFLLCFLLSGELCKKQIPQRRYITMWIIAILSVLRIWSATCLIGLAMYMVILYSKSIRRVLGRITIRKIAIAFVVIFVLIYYLRIQNLFSVILVGILGKDLSLTGRVGLWSKAIEMIKEKWVTGWGNENNGAIILRDYYYWYAHNIVLDILLQGGCVTLLAFMGVLGSLTKQIKGYLNDERVRICLNVMIIFMIINLTESYFSTIYFYIPMIMMTSAATEKTMYRKMIWDNQYT